MRNQRPPDPLAVCDGKIRDYLLLTYAPTGRDYALASVHHTPNSSHIDRWTSDLGWVSHGPTWDDVMRYSDLDTDVTNIDAQTAQRHANAGLGGASTDMPEPPGECDYSPSIAISLRHDAPHA